MAIKANPNPSHPGEILAGIYLAERGINQTDLAKMLGCTHAKVNQIINGKRGITPEFAIQLERVLGTSAEMWVNLQAAWDLYVARKRLKKGAA